MDGAAAAAVEAHDFAPSTEAFLRDALTGLTQKRKAIPAKYFYDTRGSELFEEITRQPEYYPTRTERHILERAAPAIAGLIGPGAVLIEFGAGASRKVRLLLDALEAPAAFVPIDISGEHLLEAARALAADYPGLAVTPVAADYTQPFDLPLAGDRAEAKKVVFFPGSTVGNFAPREARGFLRKTAGLLRGGGELLIGVDLKKDPRILHAAYNDAEGVTAAFNLNLLARMNGELGATFDLAAFRHRAFYNAAESRIEMHLVSLVAQTVRLGGCSISFAAGETIHTENSYKFTVEEFQALAHAEGLAPVHVWTDADRLFSLHYMRAS